MRASRCLRLAALLATLVPGLAGCFAHDETESMPTKPGNDSPLGDRPDLPVDDKLQIANLKGKVDVVRDKYGRPHIYATNTVDALRVEGYLVAADRTMQLEFFRR